MSALDFSNSCRRLRRTESDPSRPADEVAKAQELVKKLKDEGKAFEGHRIRMVGRQLDAYSAKHLHRAIVYTANVVSGWGALYHRLCFRIESCGGKPVFIAASSADGSIHEQVFEKELRRFPGAPFHWVFFKNVGKPQGATDIAPDKFLAAVHDACARAAAAAAPGKGAPGEADADFAARLWKDGLRLKETRKMLTKVKYVKDWGDLTANICVQLSARGSKLQDQIAAAREELAAASPSSRRSSRDSGRRHFFPSSDEDNGGGDDDDDEDDEGHGQGGEGAHPPTGGGRRGSEPLNRTAPKIPLPRQSSHGNGPGTGSGASRPGLLDISGIALEGPVSPGSVGPVSPSSSSAYEPSSPLAGGPGRRPVPLGGLPRQGSGGSGLGSPAAPFVLPRSGSGPVSAGDGSSPAGRAPVSRSGSGSIRVPIIDARAHALAQASGSGLGSPTPAARDGAALG